MKPNKQDRELHDKVDSLTTSLDRLRLELREVREEQRIERQELARLRATVERAQNRREPVTVHATRVETPPARARRAEPPPARRNHQAERPGPEFQVGDRIVVINRYRGQLGRTSVVTRVHGNKVYFNLDGNPTYRWAHNVERID